MAEDTLHPGLRQIAEQYLSRPLEAQEAQQLLNLQQQFQRQPAPPQAAVQQARQQTQQAISQGQARAASVVRNTLESIQASSGKALEEWKKEEEAVLELLKGCQSLADLHASSLQPAMAGLQAGSRLALIQIAGHLSNLAKREVENCFSQYMAPLASQLQMVIQRLNEQEAAKATAEGAQSVPAAQDSTQPAQAGVHVPPTQTSME